MKDQKKWELLKFAYDNYPKGTNFKQERCEEIRTASGNYAVNNVTVYDIDLDMALYIYSESNEKWAEIVKPKIAVKVDLNESKILANHLGIKHDLGEFTGEIAMYLEDTHPDLMKDGCNYDFAPNAEDKGYQIIPFSDFAKEHNIKLPLLTSEDGVDLYEGDYYWCANNLHGIWSLTSCSDTDRYIINSESIVLDCERFFSTKQAALDWIEAQKPKRNYLSGGEVYFEIEDNSIKFLSKLKETTHAIHFLTKWDLDLINKVMQELS